MEKITKKDLTIVELVSFKHSIFVGVEPTRNVTRYIYYYPTKKELHGKTITKSCLFGGTDGGIIILLSPIKSATIVSSGSSPPIQAK